MNPTCCGISATYYRIEYGHHSYEEGFECKSCGRIRIPYLTDFDTTYMDACESIRQEGLAFDDSMDIYHGELCRFIAKIVIQFISGPLKEHEQREYYFACDTDLRDFAVLALAKKYPWNYVKQIVDLHIESNLWHPCVTYAELQELFPCVVISDDGALFAICDKVLAANPKSIVDYNKGKTNALNHLKGQVMRETKGKADITRVESILKEKMKP